MFAKLGPEGDPADTPSLCVFTMSLKLNSTEQVVVSIIIAMKLYARRAVVVNHHRIARPQSTKISIISLSGAFVN